ncbi:MAG: hypothetical protein RSA27_04225, partial [Oscillospiraceae bacterium]
MSKISIKQISSLEKVMLRDTFDKREMSTATVLKGERFSYQIMYSTGSDVKIDAVIEVKSELKNLVTIRKVGMVPSEVPAYDYRHDEDFISLEPGLFPDPLYPMEYKEIEVIPYRCHSLWVTVEIDDIIEAGKYDIEICFVNSEMEIFESATMQLEVIDAILQKQELIYTQWFHGDCIASYYNIPMFSEEHWRRMEQFVKMAVKEGINMILTPIFTPPLDTKVGGERPTIQLVGVKKSENTYIFDFTKLKRWVDMCLENGIEYFEMSHLFTQWGAEFTPKIMAEINGEEKKIFGWEVRANSEEYLEFLDQFLPSLVAFLKQENIADKTYFHVSDEPEQKHLESYKFAASVLEKYLKEFKVFDAMSDYNFYKHG